jgi:LmbE family N-acetylglucosaminyl deacetylase
VKFPLAILVPCLLAAQSAAPRRALVVTATSADYIFGAGGTVAEMVRQGWRVDVAQFGNDEKLSLGLPPAQTRLANVQEGRAAAKLLGVKDLILMDHKSGELGYVSSSEMRTQLFALIRGIRPQVLIIPDGYSHFESDGDIRKVGMMAEEAWGYSGGATFADELNRMGLKPYGAPEVFYYSAYRPYRAREGGEGRAKLTVRDIASTLEQKITSAQLLLTRNRAWSAVRIGLGDDGNVNRYVREFITEMAAAAGSRHGIQYAEEFNHVGRAGSLPAHILERSRRR